MRTESACDRDGGRLTRNLGNFFFHAMDRNWLRITSLHEIRDSLDNLTRKQQETLDSEIGYFDRHKDRMDYKNAKALDQPLGTGAMESTCAQWS